MDGITQIISAQGWYAAVEQTNKQLEFWPLLGWALVNVEPKKSWQEPTTDVVGLSAGIDGPVSNVEELDNFVGYYTKGDVAAYMADTGGSGLVR